MGIPYHQEDFGQTLGVWGVGSGPYLVLPILGPSSVRDGTGLLVDAVVRNEIRNQIVDLETWQEWTWTIVDAIDTRANVAFRYYETGSPFEYEWVRMLYSTKRQLDIEK
jgi:phospholipid-binding lipoprotein MlaA